MLHDVLDSQPRILSEFAIAERLRRLPGITLHPTLFNTPLIYGPAEARAAMAALYLEYLGTASDAGLPLLLTAPTWRLDAARVAAAGVPASINADAVLFLTELRDQNHSEAPALVGALTGPQNDCYRPDLAPNAEQAEAFHTPQIDSLSVTDADFLLAQTLPSTREALGIARAMAATDKPYLISFCTGQDGKVLDGIPLPEAMDTLDQQLSRPPTGYFVNCTHPKFILNAYRAGSIDRLIGIQANASSKDVTQLNDSSATESDPVEDWAKAMLDLHQKHDVKVLGGCCGTSLPHMQAIVALFQSYS